MDKEAFNKAAELLGLDPDELAAKIDIPESPAQTVVDEADKESKLRRRLTKHNSRVSIDGYEEPSLPDDETREEWRKNIDKSLDSNNARTLGKDSMHRNSEVEEQDFKDPLWEGQDDYISEREDWSNNLRSSLGMEQLPKKFKKESPEDVEAVEDSEDVGDIKVQQEKERKKKKIKIRKKPQPIVDPGLQDLSNRSKDGEL